MDLAALGAEDHAWALANAYRQAGGDPGDDATLSFFAAYRAWVRTKVDCLRAELSADNPSARSRSARRVTVSSSDTGSPWRAAARSWRSAAWRRRERPRWRSSWRGPAAGSTSPRI